MKVAQAGVCLRVLGLFCSGDCYFSLYTCVSCVKGDMCRIFVRDTPYYYYYNHCG